MKTDNHRVLIEIITVSVRENPGVICVYQASVAQLVEQGTENPCVGGSSPL